MWNAELNSILSLYLTISMVVPNTADLNPYIFHMISWREEKGERGEEDLGHVGGGDGDLAEDPKRPTDPFRIRHTTHLS